MSTTPRPEKTTLTRAELLYQRWEEVLCDPRLCDLPYKVETNRYGQLVMTPHKPLHSGYQGMIVELLRAHLATGVIAPELAIATEDGVKVADVAWMSAGLWSQIKTESAATRAPEICVEVLSDRNTLPEIERKAPLYRAWRARGVDMRWGAREVLYGHDAGTPPCLSLGS